MSPWWCGSSFSWSFWPSRCKIISFGYLPTDDALRHAAKAVSGKPWSDILVLGPPFRDQNFVWHDFLRQIHLATHCSTDTLVVFEVVALFILVALSPLPWLKRPGGVADHPDPRQHHLR